MSDTPAIYGQFGQALGLAERTLSAILRDHLAQRNTVPEAWYTLRLLATRGPGYPRDDLTHLLVSPGFDADAGRALLAGLEVDGLIRGGAGLDLTPAGEALIRGSVSTSAASPCSCSASSTSTTSKRPYALCRRSPPRRPHSLLLNRPEPHGRHLPYPTDSRDPACDGPTVSFVRFDIRLGERRSQPTGHPGLGRRLSFEERDIAVSRPVHCCCARRCRSALPPGQPNLGFSIGRSAPCVPVRLDSRTETVTGVGEAALAEGQDPFGPDREHQDLVMVGVVGVLEARVGDDVVPSPVPLRCPHRGHSLEPIAVLESFGLAFDHDVEPLVPVIAAGQENDPAVGAEVDLLLLTHPSTEMKCSFRPHRNQGWCADGRRTARLSPRTVRPAPAPGASGPSLWPWRQGWRSGCRDGS